MKSFKSLNFKEKMEYIGILAIYPLILLYEQLGKSVKFLNSKARQITASILTVCLLLTMIPLSSIIANAKSSDGAWYDLKLTFEATKRLGSGTIDGLIHKSYIKLTGSGMNPTNAIDVDNHFWEDPVMATNSITVYFGTGQLQEDGSNDGVMTARVKVLPDKIKLETYFSVLRTFEAKVNLYYKPVDSDEWVWYYGWYQEFYGECIYSSEMSHWWHAPEEVWNSDENNHWHNCLMNCDEIYSEEAHSYTEDYDCTTPLLCDTCGYEKTPAYSHVYDDKYDTTCNNYNCNYVRHLHDGVDGEFVKWTAKSGKLTAGNYYLTESNSTALDGSLIIPAGKTVNLCLNGKTLNMGSNYIDVKDGAVLNICDCKSSQGKITSTHSYQTIFNRGAGSVTVSGGTVTNTNGGGIRNYSAGSVTVSGGCVSSTNSYGITNNEGTLLVSGGKVSGADYGIANDGGTLYLSGNPTISGNDTDYADLCLYDGDIYAENADGASAYIGGALTVKVDIPTAGNVVVNNVTSQNSTYFSVTNSGYELKQDGNNLVLAKMQSHTCDYGTTGVCKCGNVYVDERAFPDANFLAYVKTLSGANDLVFTPDELAKIKTISVYSKSIESLKGIEHFTELTLLSCGRNSLTSLDISKNTALLELTCYNNDLISLDVSNNTELSYLSCYGNNLTSLNLSQNTLLEMVYCTNNKLETLDISKNTALELLWCYSNDLTNLDVSKNIALENLSCSHNNITSLDLSENTAITSFSGTNQTSSITIDQKTMTFDMSTLDGNFDGSKATVTTEGCSLNGNILTVKEGESQVKYTYATDNGDNALSVTLSVKNFHTHRAFADDGNCLTEVLCECDKVMVEARSEHTSTGDNVATYTKKAICDVCSTEYGEKLVDSVAPTGEITIGENGWLKFWNTVTFGVFCKDYVEIEITGADAQTDVKSIEYYLSDTAISDTEIGNVTGWQTYADKINITANDKRFVYAKITDNAGNVTYLSVDGGVVVYTDSAADTQSVTYTLTTKEDKDINVTLNGNTVKSISLGTNEIDAANYTVDTNGKITLKGDYLDTLSADTYTFTVSYNPLGETYVEAEGNVAPTTTTFEVLVEKQKVTPPTIDGKVYTGETLTADITDTALYTVTTNEGGKNVAAYDVVLTLKDGNNYKWDATEGVDGDKITLKFQISKAKNEWTENPAIVGWTYGEAVKAPTGTDKFIEGNYGIAYYDKDKNPISTPSNAGEYYAQIFVADTTNFTGLTSEYLPFTIKKAPLTITANPHTITYGDAPGNNGVTYSGFVNGENENVLGGTLSFEYSYAQYGNVGNTYTITPKGLTAANYEITFVPGTLAVKKLLIDFDWETLSPEDLVYDGNDKEIGTTVKNQVTSGQYDIWLFLEYHGDTKNVTEEGFYAQIKGTAGSKASNYRVDTSAKSPVYKITKATPETNFPTGFNIDTDKKLSDIDLTGFDGYTWDAPDTVVEYDIHEYAMTFTPADTQNYVTVSKMIKVTGGDVTAPTGEITLKDNKWDEFLNNITFGLFFKETQRITITAADTESGVKEIAYYLSTEELSVEDVKALENSKWTVYTDAFNVEPDNKYVIYTRITDNAGNAAIINSDGVVLDSIKPVIAGVEDGKDIYGDAVFTVDEDYLDTVTLDGEPIEVKDGKYSVPADNKEHTIVVTDKTGNAVTYKLTVYKNYKVSFVVDGKELSSSEVGYSKDATLPEIPKKDGYTAKWDVDGKNITADTVITAVYEKIPQSPQTGDNTNIWLWLAVMFVSGLSIFGIVITKKRKEEETK